MVSIEGFHFYLDIGYRCLLFNVLTSNRAFNNYGLCLVNYRNDLGLYDEIGADTIGDITSTMPYFIEVAHTLTYLLEQ